MVSRSSTLDLLASGTVASLAGAGGRERCGCCCDAVTIDGHHVA